MYYDGTFGKKWNTKVILRLIGIIVRTTVCSVKDATNASASANCAAFIANADAAALAVLVAFVAATVAAVASAVAFAAANVAAVASAVAIVAFAVASAALAKVAWVCSDSASIADAKVVWSASTAAPKVDSAFNADDTAIIEGYNSNKHARLIVFSASDLTITASACAVREKSSRFLAAILKTSASAARAFNLSINIVRVFTASE